jgi:hypothetical protein
MTDLYPILGFAAGCIWAMAMALMFNVRTASRVRAVQTAVSKEKQPWPFWSDTRRVRAFLFNPNSLYDPCDTSDVRDAKALLIKHRATLWRSVLAGCIGFIVCPIIGLAAAFIIASPR